MSSTCVSGRAREDLGVEVPPAELAHEGIATQLPGAHRKRAGRDAAEVQIRREPRGRVGSDRVVPSRAVSVQMLPEPRRRPLDAGRLAAAHGSLC